MLVPAQAPDSTTVTFVYDILVSDNLSSTNTMGKLVVMQDAHQRKEMNYDDLGRIEKESRQMVHEGSGLLRRSFKTRYFYDFLDRITKIHYPEKIEGDGGVTVCYGYNALGQPKEIKAELSHTSTGPGTSTLSACSYKTIVEHIDYNEFGQMTSVLMGNRIKTIYDYDIKGRVKELLYEKEGTPQVKAAYTYNIQNSIMNVTYTPLTSNGQPCLDTIPPCGITRQPAGDSMNASLMQHVTNVSYRYDGLNRLTYAKGEATLYDGYDTGNIQQKNFHREYAYNLHGNLTAKTFHDPSTGELQKTWNYLYQNHRVTAVRSNGSGHLLMRYDAVGNMTVKINDTQHVTQAMTYDYQNRIIRVSRERHGTEPEPEPEFVGRYTYDHQGFRLRKRSRQAINFVEDGESMSENRWYELTYHNQYFATEKQENMDGQTIPDSDYSINNIYLNGVRIAAMEESGAARYFLTDQVDSVKVVADDSGNAVSRVEYLPYGETWFTEGTENFAPKYNSQELDKESDLYYFNARHYDPELARFVSADTVIDGVNTTAGWNRYMYVHGNPIRYKDPTGHFWEELGNLIAGKGYNTNAQVESNQSADFKQQLLKSIDDQYKNKSNTSRARSGTVRINGKDIVIKFTEDFSDNLVKYQKKHGKPVSTPKQVIQGIDERLLGSIVHAASQSNIDEVTISGLQRPDSGSLHDIGTNTAVDIASVGRKNADGKIKTFSFSGKKGQSTQLSKPATEFRDALRDNVPGNASYTEILDPNAFFRSREDEDFLYFNDTPNTGSNALENEHKNHLHFGVKFK